MIPSRLARAIVLFLTVIGGVSGQASAQVAYEVLATFEPPEVRGANPYGGLVQASDGTFYGTTYSGGPNWYGTVFRIDSDGTLTTIYAFAGTDGAWPRAGLLHGSDGSFYGTTEQGGLHDAGTVFRIDGNGTLTTLYSFAGIDGRSPEGRLVQGSDGSFYGTTSGGGPNSKGTVFRLDSGGTLTTLHAFDGTDGELPWAGLIQGSDGSFYGTTIYGGQNGLGTVFRMDSSGTLTTLYSLAGSDGANPYGGLIEGADGRFYGTTYSGGANGFGTVFRLDTDGTLTTLYAFAFSDGAWPATGLVQGSDGRFYGTTESGGLNGGAGTVFRIEGDGTLTTLHGLGGADGAYPWTSLIQGGDGSFYGTTVNGGPGDGGVIFRLRFIILPPQDLLEVTNAPATAAYGTTFTVGASGGSGTGALSFSATGACSNTAGGALITMTSGTGTCAIVASKAGDAQYSDTASAPALIAATKATQATLTVNGASAFAAGGTSFTVRTSGGSGTGAVTFDASGACSNTSGGALISVTNTAGTCSIVATKGADANYDATTSAAASVTAVAAVQFTYEVLKTFDPPHVVGAHPYAGLVLGSDGSFYGTTMDGGPNGYGTVFRVDNAGTLTTLHGFGYSDGAHPQPSLVRGSDGRFYGATSGGGLSGSGTVFRLESDGTLTTLRQLYGPTDGQGPAGALVQGSDGNFYGTATFGGQNGAGTVFRIDSTGTLTTLHAFWGFGGAYPQAGLVLGSDGSFYGTTTQGGPYGQGTVYRIDSGGTLTTLHAFDGSDGGWPSAGLVQASDGSFYGTTSSGGPHGNGTVFRIDSSGTLTTLHAFSYFDGSSPWADLVQASDGSFYGTTSGGGSLGHGTVFRIASSGTLTTLHQFAGSAGGRPYAAVVQASDGSLFGTTNRGGPGDNGVIFRLQIGGVSSQQLLEVTGAPATAAYGSSFAVATSGGSGTGAVTFNTSGACITIGDALIMMTSGTGTCSIVATKAGDEQHIDTTSEPVLVAATKAEQVPLTITGAPATAAYLAFFVVGTSGGSGTGDVTFTVSGACSNAIAPALVQITSGTGTCTITVTKPGDENYLAAPPAQVVVSIVDLIAPSITTLLPDRDEIQFAAGVPISVGVFDPGAVTSVSVNGVPATLVSGTTVEGTWQIIMPVVAAPYPVVHTFTVTAVDGAGNVASRTLIIDNDGIDSVIDRARDNYSIDQSNIVSSEFNDGVTSGTVSGVYPFFRVRKLFGIDGVRMNVGSGAMTAWFCSGTEKYIRLDASEAAHVSCNGTTATVEAVSAAPHIELYKLTTDLDGYSYYYQIDLGTGQRVSTGSPVTAHPANTSPIVVTIVQIADDGTETPVGAFSLDPGESAELSNVTPGPNREDLLELNVLAGQVSATLNGAELELGPGTHNFVPDLTSPVPSLSSNAGDPTSHSPIPVSVVFNEPVQGFHAGALQLVNATVLGFTGSGAVYSFDLVPAGLGVVSATVPAGAAIDAAGNGNVEATLSRTVVARSDQTVTFGPIDDATYGSAPLTLIATASSGLPVTFAASGSCAVSGSTLTLVGVGLCTVTASQAGNDSYHPAPDVQRTFRVLHSWSGVLQPVNSNGSSVFKLGSTVPVKFQLTDGSAAVTSLAARLYLSRVSNGITGTEIEAVSTNAADAGNVFRYTDGQYILNLNTKGLQAGTWELRIDLLDGESRSVLVSLKK